MTAAAEPPASTDRPEQPDDGDELVELADFPTGSVEPELLAARLEAEGIRTFKFSTATGGLGFLEASTTRHGGIQVQVRRVDEARARILLEGFLAERADDHVDADGVGDPLADADGSDAGVGGDGDGV